jgi:cytochrome b561
VVLKGAPDRYGLVAIALHWWSALIIIVLLVVGIAAANVTDPAVSTRLLRIHAPLGVLVLILTIARIAWRLADVRPEPPADQPQWQSIAANIVQTGLYGLILVLGASGIGVVVLSRLGPTLFGDTHQPLPGFATLRPFLAHKAAAFLLIVLLLVHVGAALYHHFVRHDRLLARMGIGRGVTPPKRSEQ